MRIESLPTKKLSHRADMLSRDDTYLFYSIESDLIYRQHHEVHCLRTGKSRRDRVSETTQNKRQAVWIIIYTNIYLCSFIASNIARLLSIFRHVLSFLWSFRVDLSPNLFRLFSIHDCKLVVIINLWISYERIGNEESMVYDFYNKTRIRRVSAPHRGLVSGFINLDVRCFSILRSTTKTLLEIRTIVINHPKCLPK